MRESANEHQTTTPTSTPPASGGGRIGSRTATWLRVLTGVVALGLLAGVVVLVANGKDDAATTQAVAGEITYEVSFDHPVQGGVLSTNIAVAYTDSDGRITQTTARTVPWITTVDITSPGRLPAVTATNDDTDQTIVCTVRSGDTVLSTRVASGPHASAACA